VEQRGGGNQDATAEASIRAWLEEANPRFDSLMIAASTALRLPLSEMAEERADAVSRVRSAIESSQGWTTSNPCPDATVRDRFEVIIARFQFVALAFDSASNKLLDAHLAATLDRLEDLNSGLRLFSPMCGDARGA
jgi:hypothetical protein